MVPCYRLGVEVNFSALKNDTCVAAEEGNESTLEYLLAVWSRQRSSLRIIDAALEIAIHSEHLSCIRQLMEYGATPDMYMLYEARREISLDVWQKLLDGGWDINSPGVDGFPNVVYYMRNVNPTLYWFLSHGVSLSARSVGGPTVISLAIRCASAPVLRLLLENADADTIASSNVLHEATWNKGSDCIEILKLLVDDFGVDVHALSTYSLRHQSHNKPELTPLQCAVRWGRRDHVRFLLDRGARISDKDAEGLNVRLWAEKTTFNDGWEMVEEWFAEKGRSIIAAEAEGN